MELSLTQHASTKTAGTKYQMGLLAASSWELLYKHGDCKQEKEKEMENN